VTLSFTTSWRFDRRTSARHPPSRLTDYLRVSVNVTRGRTGSERTTTLGSQAFRADGRTAQAGFERFNETQKERASVRVAAGRRSRNAWLTSEPARDSDF